MVNTKMDTQSEQRLMFHLLVGYRWISLLPPLIWLLLFPLTGVSTTGWLVLAVSVALTLLLTLTAVAVNRLLLHRPWLLVFDLFLAAVLVWYTGAERSPYYLYSLAPILAAAFFFRIRGGLVAAAVYSGFYLVVVFTAPRLPEQTVNTLVVIAQYISFFLIGAIFGYPSLLLQRLRTAHTELTHRNTKLSQSNRDLKLLHELSLAMQSSIDPTELQEFILRGLVQEMDYPRAIIGLYDEPRNTLTSWITSEDPFASGTSPRVAHTDTVPVDNDDGPLAQALRTNQVIEVMDGEAPTNSRDLNEKFITGAHYLVLPMSLRENPIGVILVDRLPAGQPLSQAERISLDHLVAHAGVALGSVRLCIYRAQREAVTEERNRIAAELHDSISQILYGLAYGMEACIQLLPHEPDNVQSALAKLHPMVVDAQGQMRKAIFEMWSDEIASDTFVAGLHRHLRTVCPTQTIALRIELPGDFNRWDSATRSHLYRITQESLANAAKHAGAHQIIVTLLHNNGHIELRIEDDGQGFNPAKVDQTHHLGLQSMAERAKGLDGAFNIQSAPREGTVISVTLPHPNGCRIETV